MKNEDYEISDRMLKSLEKCPNCDGDLRKIKDWKLRCNNCEYDFTFESRRARLFNWVFIGAVAVGAICYLIGLMV